MTVLVTGGAGYIGSHTCVELVEAGYDIVVVDNLSNSKKVALDRVENIVGKPVRFIRADVRDVSAMRRVFAENSPTSVIHFAGLKAVGESVSKPVDYYDNNVVGTLVLARLMSEFSTPNFIFSSSATVYGDPATVPITEDFPTSATNPYGRSKLIVEEILRDVCKSPGNKLGVSLLRYFNPVGAHHSGTIGEDPNGIPNNLLPYITQVAVGKLPKLSVFGDDYDTRDGTGIRDYIHVVDLARGHVRALKKLEKSETACYTYNLGTGTGVSVLELHAAFCRVSDSVVPFEIVERRPGDVAQCYANCDLAESELNWRAEYGLDRMMEDAWRWQSSNPDGYPD